MTFKHWDILCSVCLGVILVQAWMPLDDPDLGWHLAAGLWMLDQGTVPSEDFLSAYRHHWIAYSWLAELLYASVYLIGDFPGLRLLQLALAALWAPIAIGLWQTSEPETQQQRIRAAVTVLLTLPFAAAIWHLRPQWISFLLWGVLLIRAERGSLSLAFLIPYTIFWANIHTYWVFVPLVYLVYGLFEGRGYTRVLLSSALLGICGLCSPYGVSNITLLWEYSFQHQVAYSLISEFKPLSTEQGLLFWLALFSLCAGLERCIRLPKKPWALLILLALFAVAACLRIKMLPFAGVLALYLATKGSVARKDTTAPLGLAVSAIAIFCLTAAIGFKSANALSSRWQELLYQASQLEQESPKRVFSHFDDGGWLGFALYRQRPQGSAQSPVRTLIDGRSLVMGPSVLAWYGEIERNPTRLCAAIEQGELEVALLRSKKFANQSPACLQREEVRWF